MWKIKLVLEQELETTQKELELEAAQQKDQAMPSHDDEVEELVRNHLTEMIKVLKEMKKKFNKYWNKSYIMLCVPVVFDPRFKLKFINFVFTKSYPTTAKGKFDKVEELVRGLISAYTPQPIPSNVPSTQVSNDVSVKNDPWAEWDQQLNHDLQAQKTTEFDRYLDETPVPRSSDFDILNWWMGNASKYPVLSRIARDLLAVPASSVASESAFSIAEKAVSDFRSSLTPETVEALICTQDWYRTEGSTEFSTAAVDDFIAEAEE